MIHSSHVAFFPKTKILGTLTSWNATAEAIVRVVRYQNGVKVAINSSNLLLPTKNCIKNCASMQIGVV